MNKIFIFLLIISLTSVAQTFDPHDHECTNPLIGTWIGKNFEDGILEFDSAYYGYYFNVYNIAGEILKRGINIDIEPNVLSLERYPIIFVADIYIDSIPHKIVIKDCFDRTIPFGLCKIENNELIIAISTKDSDNNYIMPKNFNKNVKKFVKPNNN